MKSTESVLETAGILLATQREKLNLTLEECAESLKLSVNKLRALEAGDETPFISNVFVKGHLRSYAKLLQLSEEEILHSYHSTNTNDSSQISSSEIKQPNGKWWLPYLVGLLLIVAWFMVSGLQSADNGWMNSLFNSSVVEVDETASDNSLKEEILSSEKATKLIVNDATVEQENSIEQSDEVLFLDSSQVPPLIEGTEVPSDNIDTQTNGFLNKNDGIEAVSNVGVLKEPTNLLLDDSEILSDINPVTVNEGVMADQLYFTFAEACWVEVIDATEEVIASSVRNANSVLTVTGKAPFSIVLGNIVGTTLSINNQSVELVSQSGSRTLRITVGS